MNLLLLILEDADRVEDCLSAVVDLDVAGVQVVESATVMDVLAREAPIFAGLRELISRPKAVSKLILGLTKKDDILSELNEVLSHVGIHLDKPGVGYALLLPVAEHLGQLDFDE